MNSLVLLLLTCVLAYTHLENIPKGSKLVGEGAEGFIFFSGIEKKYRHSPDNLECQYVKKPRDTFRGCFTSTSEEFVLGDPVSISKLHQCQASQCTVYSDSELKLTRPDAGNPLVNYFVWNDLVKTSIPDVPDFQQDVFSGNISFTYQGPGDKKLYFRQVNGTFSVDNGVTGTYYEGDFKFEEHSTLDFPVIRENGNLYGIIFAD